MLKIGIEFWHYANPDPKVENDPQKEGITKIQSMQEQDRNGGFYVTPQKDN